MRVERYRRSVVEDTTVIDIPRADDEDATTETLGSWAARSAVLMPFGRVLYRLARMVEGSVVEFGTGSGVSAAYLSAGLERAGGDGRVVSVEAHPVLAERAEANLRSSGFHGVTVVLGQEREVAPNLLETVEPALVHVDSGHLYPDTAGLAELVAGHLDSVVVCYDDIRWSPDMARFWGEACGGRFRVSHAVDLDLWGVVLVGPGAAGPAQLLHARAPTQFKGAELVDG
ncbi:MAG: O-methyltransferase [Acidimicrobiales bacterium]